MGIVIPMPGRGMAFLPEALDDPLQVVGDNMSKASKALVSAGDAILTSHMEEAGKLAVLGSLDAAMQGIQMAMSRLWREAQQSPPAFELDGQARIPGDMPHISTRVPSWR